MSIRISPLTYLGIGVVSTALLVHWPLPALAACTLAPTAGDDTYTCDSGAGGALNDTAGNNSLIFPGAGAGTLSGNVTFGAGNDLLQMDSGTIDGAVDMGDGANIFRLNVGTITGAVSLGAGIDIVQISGGQAGAISSGDGADSFAMSGGTIDQLAQGDGLDTFSMSGGTIKGAFLDGDQAIMTGGTIGRVDMKLDNNLFDLQNGQIIGNLVAGFGNDTILVSGGSIGGNISVSGGNDIIVVSGGDIGGQILASFGDDDFTWSGGGLIHSAITLADGTDRALLKDLSETTLASTPQINGGTGTDTLTFDNSQSATPTRYVNWETVRLDNGSRLSLGGDFLLGDSGTGTGTMAVDGNSVLLVSQGSISAFDPSQSVSLSNSGLIDMTSASSSATDSLTINGNYTGNNAQMALQSVLGADASPSDKLVVNQGSLQGSTHISITNLAGPGDLTTQNGIPVVEALNGASGSDLAFSLRGPVSAGAYDYYLFKGGVTAGTEQNWYLRSALVVTPLPEPIPAEGTPELPGVEPGDKPIPLYRPAVPVYTSLLPAAHQLLLASLGTYHERQGEQNPRGQTGALAAGWGRVYASSSRQSWAGTVNPRLDGHLSGFQIGSDLYGKTTDNGQLQRLGFFVGHSRLQGNIDGFNGGFQHRDAGKTTLRGDSLGLYWTLIDASGGYVDVVQMGTRLDGNSESNRGIKLKTKGHDVLASAEVGMPFAISQRWAVEPQAQVIVHRTSLANQHDAVSDVGFTADTSVTTRLGARLRGNYRINAMALQPYLRSNVWHTSSGTNRVVFNDFTDIDTEQKSTTLDASVGATLQVSSSVSLYGEVGYDANLDANAFNGRKGTFGVRVDF